jgi:hypothetical protein
MVNTAALSEPSNSHLDDESLRSMRLEAASSTPAAVSGLSGKQDTERGGGGLASFGGIPAGSKHACVGLIVAPRSMFGFYFVQRECGSWRREGVFQAVGGNVGGNMVCLTEYRDNLYWTSSERRKLAALIQAPGIGEKVFSILVVPASWSARGI